MIFLYTCIFVYMCIHIYQYLYISPKKSEKMEKDLREKTLKRGGGRGTAREASFVTHGGIRGRGMQREPTFTKAGSRGRGVRKECSFIRGRGSGKYAGVTGVKHRMALFERMEPSVMENEKDDTSASKISSSTVSTEKEEKVSKPDTRRLHSKNSSNNLLDCRLDKGNLQSKSSSNITDRRNSASDKLPDSKNLTSKEVHKDDIQSKYKIKNRGLVEQNAGIKGKSENNSQANLQRKKDLSKDFGRQLSNGDNTKSMSIAHRPERKGIQHDTEMKKKNISSVTVETPGCHVRDREPLSAVRHRQHLKTSEPVGGYSKRHSMPIMKEHDVKVPMKGISTDFSVKNTHNKSSMQGTIKSSDKILDNDQNIQNLNSKVKNKEVLSHNKNINSSSLHPVACADSDKNAHTNKNLRLRDTKFQKKTEEIKIDVDNTDYSSKQGVKHCRGINNSSLHHTVSTDSDITSNINKNCRSTDAQHREKKEKTMIDAEKFDDRLRQGLSQINKTKNSSLLPVTCTGPDDETLNINQNIRLTDTKIINKDDKKIVDVANFDYMNKQGSTHLTETNHSSLHTVDCTSLKETSNVNQNSILRDTDKKSANRISGSEDEAYFSTPTNKSESLAKVFYDKYQNKNKTIESNDITSLHVKNEHKKKETKGSSFLHGKFRDGEEKISKTPLNTRHSLPNITVDGHSKSHLHSLKSSGSSTSISSIQEVPTNITEPEFPNNNGIYQSPRATNNNSRTTSSETVVSRTTTHKDILSQKQHLKLEERHSAPETSTRTSPDGSEQTSIDIVDSVIMSPHHMLSQKTHLKLEGRHSDPEMLLQGENVAVSHESQFSSDTDISSLRKYDNLSNLSLDFSQFDYLKNEGGSTTSGTPDPGSPCSLKSIDSQFSSIKLSSTEQSPMISRKYSTEKNPMINRKFSTEQSPMINRRCSQMSDDSDSISLYSRDEYDNISIYSKDESVHLNDSEISSQRDDSEWEDCEVEEDKVSISSTAPTFDHHLNFLLENERGYLDIIAALSDGKKLFPRELQPHLGAFDTLTKVHNGLYMDLCNNKDNPVKFAECFLDRKKAFEVYQFMMIKAPVVELKMKNLNKDEQKTLKNLQEPLRRCRTRLHFYFMTLEKLEGASSPEIRPAIHGAIEMLQEHYRQADHGILIDSVRECPIQLHLHLPLRLHNSFNISGPKLKKKEYHVLLFEDLIVLTTKCKDNYTYVADFRLEQAWINNLMNQAPKSFAIEVNRGGGKASKYTLKANSPQVKGAWIKEITEIQERYMSKVKKHFTL